jgi:hypothetical protein
MEKTVNNLAQLLAGLRSRSVEEAIEWLPAAAGACINICYETRPRHPPAVPTAATTDAGAVVDGTTAAGADSTATAVADVISHTTSDHPPVRNEPNVPAGASRMLLTVNRTKADFGLELARQCNGVVLEYPTWRVLSYPAKIFNPKYRLSEVLSNIENYEVFDIKDGTTVTLYWYAPAGSWRLSSTNGFDVNSYQWMGPNTYQAALSAVMKNYPNFSFKRLDKSKCYTVGFRHNDFHPLQADKPKMWFIQSCDLARLNEEPFDLVVNTSEDIGLPLQVPAVLPEKKRLLAYCVEKNMHALDRYLSAARNRKTPEIHYGFIFRSKTGQSDYMVESELLKTVRTLIYNLPKRRPAGATPITSGNRLEYAIFRAYLSNTTKSTFLGLFPQFEGRYRSYDDTFSKLSNRIIQILRNRNGREPARPPAGRIETVATSLAGHIRKHIQVNVMDSQGPSIVSDFLLDYHHLELYFTCLITDQ